jgi:alcohol dehydrogenase
MAALVSAQLFEPKQVVSVDIIASRLQLAKSYGAAVIDASRDRDISHFVREITNGEGADVAIEAVGSIKSFVQSLELVRRGGSVSAVGIFPGPAEIPLQSLCSYGIHLSMGLANLSRMSYLMKLVESGRVNLLPLITHRFSLDEAVQAYDLFENQKESCLKVLLKP